MEKRERARLARELADSDLLSTVVGEIKRELFEDFCADVDMRDGVGVEQVAQQFVALELIVRRILRKASEARDIEDIGDE